MTPDMLIPWLPLIQGIGLPTVAVLYLVFRLDKQIQQLIDTAAALVAVQSDIKTVQVHVEDKLDVLTRQTAAIIGQNERIIAAVIHSTP